jgi:hypothetical protein
MSPGKDNNPKHPRPVESPTQGIESVQMAMVIEIFKSISNQNALNARLIMEFIQDLKKYREARESREQNGESGVNTTQRVEQRVEAALKSRLAFLYWFIDRAAPGIVIAIILAVLKKLGLL